MPFARVFNITFHIFIFYSLFCKTDAETSTQNGAPKLRGRYLAVVSKQKHRSANGITKGPDRSLSKGEKKKGTRGEGDRTNSLNHKKEVERIASCTGKVEGKCFSIFRNLCFEEVSKTKQQQKRKNRVHYCML